jgi:hypothetical protein
LRVLELGVFANPSSPYLPLLRGAGAELGDVRHLVRTQGLEGALGSLYDAGVFVTLDEVKGRTSIERKGISIPVRQGAFDNPLLTAGDDPVYAVVCLARR